jgi:hypothetical protein
MEIGYKKLDTCCDENNIDDGARKILSVVRPKWSPENIKFKVCCAHKYFNACRISCTDTVKLLLN